MRIAYLTNKYPTVSHTFIRREIQALESAGVSIERFSIRDTSLDVVDQDDKLEAAKTEVLLRPVLLASAVARLLLFRPLRFLRAATGAIGLWRRSHVGILRHGAYLAEACVLFRACQGKGIEHVHAHFSTNSTTVAMLCFYLGGPTYSFTTHGPEEFDRPESDSLAWKIRQASFVVAISSFCRSQLQRWAAYEDWRKIKIVRCGLDASYLSTMPVAIPNEPRFVCVARLAEQKGLMVLLEAVDLLKREGRRFSVRIVGDGVLRQHMEDWIALHELGDSISILGWRTGQEVKGELDAARCLVLPSFAEGLPVVIMEALAAGRPAITTYIAGIPELVSPNANGWLIPAGDPQALADAMRQAIETPINQLAEMGIEGRSRVQERHDSRKEAKVLLEAFEEATGKSALKIERAL